MKQSDRPPLHYLLGPCGLAMLLLCVVGCHEVPKHPALRFGLADAPITLDPRYATDAASARILRLIYPQLVDFDASARPVPWLASWIQPSPTRYRFTLGEWDRLYPDGSRLSSADVAATYRSVLDPATGSPHRASLDMIERIATPDASTLEFTLNRPDPLFPGRLVLGIMPADRLAAGRRFDREPVGSGPFALVDWPEDGRLRLRRRSDGATLEFLRVPDPTVRALKLLRGEIDMVQNNLPYELIGWLDRQPGVKVTRRAGSSFSYLGFNLEDSVAGSHAVRAAIACALDVDAIVKYVFAGAARPAAALFPPDHWAGSPSLRRIAHDPDRARALLRAAGYDAAHPVHLTYKTSSAPFRLRLATIIQHQLREVGIEVSIRSYDWGTFYGDIKAGRFQMYSLAWVGLQSPDAFRYIFHSDSVPPAGANRGRYRDPSTDALIDAAEAATGPARQAELYRRLEAHLLDALPYVPLWYEGNVFVSRADILGYRLAADGNYDGLRQVRRVAVSIHAEQ